MKVLILNLVLLICLTLLISLLKICIKNYMRLKKLDNNSKVKMVSNNKSKDRGNQINNNKIRERDNHSNNRAVLVKDSQINNNKAVKAKGSLKISNKIVLVKDNNSKVSSNQVVNLKIINLSLNSKMVRDSHNNKMDNKVNHLKIKVVLALVGQINKIVAKIKMAVMAIKILISEMINKEGKDRRIVKIKTI